MKKLKIYIPIVLLTIFASCTEKENTPTPVTPGQPKELPCEITTDMQLTNHNATGVDYVVSCNAEVLSGTLSIAPDVIIEFKQGAGLDIKENAAIMATGTTNEPIIMRGQGSGNTWGGVVIASKNNTSKLSFCNISNGGSVVNYISSVAGASIEAKTVITVWGRADLSNVSIDGSNGIGLAVYEEATISLSALNIKNCAEQPILTYAGQLKSNFNVASCTFSNNGSSYISLFAVSSNAIVAENAIIAKAPIPYLAITDLFFDGEATISAGADIRFANNLGMGVNEGGALTINGTATEPVVIRGATPAAGFWAGLAVNSKNPKNVFNYLKISDGGSKELGVWAGKANISVGDKIAEVQLTMNNCTSDNVSGCEVTVSDQNATFVNNSPLITDICSH